MSFDSIAHRRTNKAGSKDWLALAVLALPTLLLSISLSVVYLALPQLSQDIGADSNQQLWIIDIYGFTTAGFLVAMGTLGDTIGRRKLLLIGGTVFGLASVAAAFSTNAEMLIAARAVMGVAGATLMPSTLALITNIFRDPQQRAFAVSCWMTCCMSGFTAGPILGGMLLAHFWWGSIFLMGVPVMVLLAACGPTLLPESKSDSPGRFDLTSAALSLGAILPLTYGLKEAARNGVGFVVLISMTVGLAVGVAFVRRQRLISNPMIDLTLFSNRRFRAAAVLVLVPAVISGGTFFLTSQSLQLVWDLTPLQAAFALLPQALLMIIASMLSPVLPRYVSVRTIIVTGMVITAVGSAALSQVDSSQGVVMIILAYSIIELGIGGTGPLIANLIMSSAPTERAGSVASIQETCADFGIAMGVAGMGSVGLLVYRNELAQSIPADTSNLAARAANQSLSEAVPLGGHVLESARAASIMGLNVVAVICAVTSLGLAVMAAKTLGRSTADAEFD